MSESPNLIPIQEKHAGGGCGCGEHDSDRLTLDARPIPHRLRHAAVIGAASSLNVGEGFDSPRTCPRRCSLRSISCPSPSSTRFWRPRTASPASRSCASPEDPPRGRPSEQESGRRRTRPTRPVSSVHDPPS